jgi:hypothetical protein
MRDRPLAVSAREETWVAVYSDTFLLTQFGRSIAIHCDQPQWQTGRHRNKTRHGTLAGVDGTRMIIKVHGEVKSRLLCKTDSR